MYNELISRQSEYTELVTKIASKYIGGWVDEDTTSIDEDDVARFVRGYIYDADEDTLCMYYAMRDSCFDTHKLGGGAFEFDRLLEIDVYNMVEVKFNEMLKK